MKNMFSITICQLSYSHSIGGTRSIIPDLRLTLDLSKFLFLFFRTQNIVLQ